MIVRALCTIHDSNGWHNAGDIFETEDNLGTAAVVIGEGKQKAEEAAEPKPEAEPKPKSTRRKKVSE